MSASIDSLFTPFQLGSLTLANRLVMAPMTRGFSSDGAPGADVAEYYRRRAGLGLIVTEGVGVDHPASLGMNSIDGGGIPVLHGEAPLAGWRRVVAAVHAAGGRIMPQLWHQGVLRVEGTGPVPTHPSSRPSGIYGPVGRPGSIPAGDVELLQAPTRPMTESEIGDVIAGFARSAANAKAVGFDGIALHGAHGYLIDTFFWHETNLRADSWGGAALQQRARFGVEIVAAIRAAIGPDMPIMFRFSQWKQQEFAAVLANTPQELGLLLEPLAAAGVDLFDGSQRNFDEPTFAGSALNLAGWAKKLTGKPACTVGKIGLDADIYVSMAQGSAPISLDPLMARFDRGEFDLVGLGRSVIADADFADKLRRGEPRQRFSITQLHALT